MAAQKQQKTAALASTLLCIIALLHVSMLSQTTHLVLGLGPACRRTFTGDDYWIVFRGSLTAAGPKNRLSWNRSHCGLCVPYLAHNQLLQPGAV